MSDISFVKLPKGEGVNFDKESLVPVRAILRWSGSADADLACIVETDHKITVVQALDRNYGSLDEDPYVALDHDSRTGGVETVTINMARADNIRRIIVFAYIYRGGTWKDIRDASVTVEHPEQNFVIELANGGRTKTCALFELVNNGAGLTLENLEQYFKGFHQDLDRFYGWPNINWTAGSK